MSKELSAAASKEFDSEVKHAYQEGAKLPDTVTQRPNTIGDTYNFRSMGKGMANQKASSEDVTPMNVSHALVPCVLENWNAPEYTDIFDDTDVNFSERVELSETIGEALGRRRDQIIIDAMAASASYAGTVGTDVGGTGTDLNVAKLRRAARYLNAKGVPMSDRFCVHSAEALDALLGQTETTSADYNSVRALVNGEIDTFLGFKFKMVEDRDEGGLPKSGSVRDNFCYHRKAVGEASASLERISAVDWVAHKTSWLSNGFLKCGGVARDGNGIVKVQCTEA